MVSPGVVVVGAVVSGLPSRGHVIVRAARLARIVDRQAVHFEAGVDVGDHREGVIRSHYEPPILSNLFIRPVLGMGLSEGC